MSTSGDELGGAQAPSESRREGASLPDKAAPPDDVSSEDGPVEMAFVISQLQQHNEGYRLIITLSVQLMTVLVLANVTLVGYAISQQIAGILLIGPIFPVGIIVAVYIVGRAAFPIIYSFVNLEARYGRGAADWLGRTAFSIMFGADYVERLLAIGRLPTWPQRFDALQKMPIAVVGTGRGIIRLALGVVALAQVGAALVLWAYFDWRMF